ncbi:DUF4330 domain-containing protein [Haloarcula laminariae]|uniref:DUF4330 domain-containing protein n=1 Tax=Haloarcula laminariae TaxID=2961577 RepID=UPI00240667FF|nr:DUF4330 domain-containing protein [Halomicroarcula sp. FL173]
MNSGELAGGLIDDEGNLFGVVNVVDALVVLLVLSAAGVGLLVVGDETGLRQSPETGTTFVTLDLGPNPDYVATALEEGDTYTPTEASNLTVTDIYLAPQGDEVRALARARLDGVRHNGTLTYAEEPVRLDRSLNIATETYNVTGNISAVGEGSNLNTGTTTVVLRDTVPAADADAIAPGDEITVAGRTAATVEEVAVYPTTEASGHRVLVEATLSTYARQGVSRFGGTPVRPGRQITLPGPGYTLDGRIQRADGGLESDSLTNRTVTLEATSVRPEVATAIRPGQTERAGSRTTAYVTDVRTVPTPIVSTTQNGSVAVSDHPTLRDVTLTTELRVKETATGSEFRGERLQYGSTVVLDLGPVTVRTTVVDIGR